MPKGIRFRLHDATWRDIRALPLPSGMQAKCVGFMQEVGQLCYETGTDVVDLAILARCTNHRKTRRRYLKHCLEAGVLRGHERGWVMRDFFLDNVNSSPEEVARYRKEQSRRGSWKRPKRRYGMCNEINHLAPVFGQASEKSKNKAKEKNKNPTTCTPYANEKASPMPEAAPQSTAAQHPDIPHAGTMDRSLAEQMALAQAAIAKRSAQHPEAAIEAPFRPRRVAAAPPATPRQAKTPQRQIEAPGPHPPTPPPNEHEILEALLEMDVDERDWDTRDRVRGMIVAGKIERLTLEHAAYEYRMRRRDATREPIHCALRWLVLRLPAGQAKLETARRAVGMVATFAESKAGMRHSADGEKSSQEKASRPSAAAG